MPHGDEPMCRGAVEPGVMLPVCCAVGFATLTTLSMHGKKSCTKKKANYFPFLCFNEESFYSSVEKLYFKESKAQTLE